jgi:hypothetical protein
MTAVQHIELDKVYPGMSVVVHGAKFGDVVTVIPQPDARHILRLVVRDQSRRRLVAIPIEWVAAVHDDHIDLAVSESDLAALPEYVPIIQPRHARFEQHTGVGYGYPWLHSLLERATALDFDDAQLGFIEDLAERKLVDLFDVAEEAALANGRTQVLMHDLPLTKGLQLLLLEVADLAREFELRPLLMFLSDAGIRASLGDSVREEIPRLMAALIILSGRVIAVYPASDRTRPLRPTQQELERAAELLDLTL